MSIGTAVDTRPPPVARGHPGPPVEGRARLDDRIHVPFAFEPSGSQIVFYEPGVDYRDAERARRGQDVTFKELSLAGLAPEAA